jgi:hypothetical protein
MYGSTSSSRTNWLPAVKPHAEQVAQDRKGTIAPTDSSSPPERIGHQRVARASRAKIRFREPDQKRGSALTGCADNQTRTKPGTRATKDTAGRTAGWKRHSSLFSWREVVHRPDAPGLRPVTGPSPGCCAPACLSSRMGWRPNWPQRSRPSRVDPPRTGPSPSCRRNSRAAGLHTSNLLPGIPAGNGREAVRPSSCSRI